MPGIQIREAREADLEAVREIYNHYVVTSTCTFQTEPEAPEERQAWLSGRGPAHPALVAEVEGAVVGWAAASPWKARCGYSATAEVSVYVRDGWHRRGVGRALLAELIHRCRAAGLHTLIGGACTEHPGSIALQESLGFVRVAHFHETGRKFGRWLDVVYLQKML
jgi:phosphinothricin acetyltransferase